MSEMPFNSMRTTAAYAAYEALQELEDAMATMYLDAPPSRGTVADLQRPTLDALREAILIYDETHSG